MENLPVSTWGYFGKQLLPWYDPVISLVVVVFTIYVHITLWMKDDRQMKQMEDRMNALEEAMKTHREATVDVISIAIETAIESISARLEQAIHDSERAHLRIELLEKPILTALENGTMARNKVDALLRQIERVGQVDREIELLTEGKRHLLLEKRMGFYNVWRPEQKDQFAPERWNTFF